METYIPSSDVEESQASQLIQNVLGGVSGSDARPGGPIRKVNVEDSVINESTESSSTGRDVSQYRLHGLAQTQSELDDQGTTNERAQKGIINGGSRPGLRNNRLDAPLDTLTKNTRVKGRRQEPQYPARSPVKETRPRSKPDKSSSKNPNTSRSRGIKSTRQRSPSEMSQDSFAGDVVDPEKQFLASTKQFQVPLSELARVPGSGSRTSTDNKDGSLTSTYPPVARSPRATDGTILAPDSDCSESPGLQPLHASKYPDDSTNRRSQGELMVAEGESNSQSSNSSSAPGSSLYEPRNPEPPADDFQATQPTTESDEVDTSFGPDPPWLLAAAKASGVATTTTEDPTPRSSAKSNDTKSNTSSNRGILSLIHPKNKWRFQRYHEIVTGGQDSRLDEPEGNYLGEDGLQETQPSGDGDLLPPQSSSKKPYSPKANINKNTMDVVPDSEPSQEEPPSMVADAHTVADDKRTVPQRYALGWKRSPQTVNRERRKLPARRDPLSDDDDIPLAQISTKPRQEGKEHGGAFKVPSAGVSKTSRATHWTTEPAEVPSSVPEQDVLNARAHGSRHAANGANASKAQEIMTAKDKKHVPSRRVLERLEEEEVEESEDDAEIKKLELLDEDYQEADASRKRKRGVGSTKAPAVRRKGPTTRGAKSTAVTTRIASVRQAKRLRSMTSSTVKVTHSDATRVFALWRQDGHFYSGTVHMIQDDNRYLVKFDDETEATVSLEQMRLCELHPGDDVLLPGRTRSSKILDVSKAQDDIVVVDIDGDPEEIEMKSIRLASRTIKSAWRDRFLGADDVVPAVSPVKKSGSPTPSGVSLTSVQSAKSIRKRFLCKTGLAVSLSAGNAREKEKELLLNTIRNNGGIVLDDWTSVVRMEGKHSANNSRWVLNKDEVQWWGKDDIERVFLLADDSSQKPKFLMAIGLGIPCLSVNWLHDSIAAGEEKEWTAYMLPQGYSDRLSARISQQVDVDWGNSVHQLTDIMDNAVPAKPFQNHSILCVGSDMVPQPKGKRLPGTDEKTQEASNAVARIIICMGAHRVEAVTELRYASGYPADYDYIVVKDSCTNTVDGGMVVPWSWVKDCLIASRQLPMPDEAAASRDA